MDARAEDSPHSRIIESNGAEDLGPMQAFNGRVAVARKITAMACCVIPSFLQSPEVIEASPAPEIYKEERRRERQRYLQNRTQMEALLPETMLYSRMGGISIGAMRKQLQFLMEMTVDEPMVTIGIVPFEAPYTPAHEIAGLAMAYDSANAPIGCYEERWNILSDRRDRFFDDQALLTICEETTVAPTRQHVDIDTADRRIEKALLYLHA